MRSVFLALLALAVPLDAAALTGRPDVDPARYRQLAAEHPAVGSVVDLFTGTLIAPRWVLTAAHGAELLETMVPDASRRTFRLGGVVGRIDAVFLPEARRRLDPEADSRLDPTANAHDIALVRLAEPIAEGHPVAIDRSADRVGVEVRIVGAGSWFVGSESGRARAEIVGLPRGVVHAGTNRIDRVDPATGWFEIVFDAPDPEATALECGLAPGDSGGPVLVESGGAWVVTGILAGYETLDEDRGGRYGDYAKATRVGDYVDWIEQTMSDHANTPAAPGAMLPAEPDLAWPQTLAAQRARAYLDALNAGDDDALREFIPTHWSPASVAKRGLEGRVAQHRGIHRQFGRLTPVSVESENDLSAVVTVDAANLPIRLELSIQLQGDPPHHSDDTSIRAKR